jgi:hypothetical protein
MARIDELNQVKALANRAAGLYQAFFAGVFQRSRSCRHGQRPERMKINHEETKNTKISSIHSSCFPSCSSFLRG